MYGPLCFLFLFLVFISYIISTKMEDNKNAEFFYRGVSTAFSISLILFCIIWLFSAIK